jgi:hypothetical protein
MITFQSFKSEQAAAVNHSRLLLVRDSIKQVRKRRKPKKVRKIFDFQFRPGSRQIIWCSIVLFTHFIVMYDAILHIQLICMHVQNLFSLCKILYTVQFDSYFKLEIDEEFELGLLNSGFVIGLAWRQKDCFFHAQYSGVRAFYLLIKSI